MKRRVPLLLAVLGVVACVASLAFSASNIVPVYVNGRLAGYGLIQKGVTYLPVRAVSEALEIQVSWNPVARTVNIGNGQVPASAQSLPSVTRQSVYEVRSSSQKIQDTVHITRTGSKYHRAGCRYLSKSDIPISRADAEARGYAPCSVCNP